MFSISLSEQTVSMSGGDEFLLQIPGGKSSLCLKKGSLSNHINLPTCPENFVPVLIQGRITILCFA